MSARGTRSPPRRDGRVGGGAGQGLSSSRSSAPELTQRNGRKIPREKWVLFSRKEQPKQQVAQRLPSGRRASGAFPPQNGYLAGVPSSVQCTADSARSTTVPLGSGTRRPNGTAVTALVHPSSTRCLRAACPPIPLTHTHPTPPRRRARPGSPAPRGAGCWGGGRLQRLHHSLGQRGQLQHALPRCRLHRIACRR